MATVKKIKYSGMVYCPEVSTSSFVARRNGKIFITGNSGFPKSQKHKSIKGAYLGFQPKPSIEIILCMMRPLSAKSYTDQALANGGGITHLDDVRIPTNEKSKRVFVDETRTGFPGDRDGDWNTKKEGVGSKTDWETHKEGRFPSNLLVSPFINVDFNSLFELQDKAKKYK